MGKDDLEARVDRIEECLEQAGYPVRRAKEKKPKPAPAEAPAGEGT